MVDLSLASILPGDFWQDEGEVFVSFCFVCNKYNHEYTME